MATRHYQGNVSLCLRAAIESHRESLQGEGEFAAHQIKRQIDGLEQRVQELQAGLDEIPVESTNDADTEESQSVLGSIEMTIGMQAIIQTFDEASSPLRLEDLLEKTELPPQELQAELSQLIDWGLIIETVDERQRFALAGDSRTTQDEEVCR
jgi:hypothetical protein